LYGGGGEDHCGVEGSASDEDPPKKGWQDEKLFLALLAEECFLVRYSVLGWWMIDCCSYVFDNTEFVIF
jgi:hypothetical protein